MARPASLRTLLAAMTTIVAVLALTLAAALIYLTTTMRHATAAVGASVESVRLAEEAEIDLLLHERARDPLVRRDIEGSLRRRLTRAQAFVTTPGEAKILENAELRVAQYIEAAHAPATPDAAAARALTQEVAYDALEALVTENVLQSQQALAAASRWDRLANALGAGVAMLALVVASIFVYWLRYRAFAPVFALSNAMERFARGDRSVRAAETGPSEMRDMSRRFNEMADSISAQRDAQIAFLGGVAHDLRNPLATLRMASAMIDPHKPLPSEERVRQTMERVARQASRMERMVNDFLDIARIEAGQLDMHLEVRDLRPMVEDVIAMFDAADGPQQVSCALPDEPLWVRCDQLRLEQVLTNLVSNAVKYSPRGSPIEVTLRRVREHAEISVKDCGVGVAPEDRERIFEPFRRVGLSKESVPGVGLGLFVVKKIVEVHGGTITVDSVLGEGSTFVVTFPLHPSPARADDDWMDREPVEPLH